QDTTAPTLSSVPTDSTVEASAPATPVSFAPPTATDLVDGTDAVSCSPASGSRLLLGPTLVTCTARDAAGNSSSAFFTVTVVDTTAPALTGVPASETGEATGPGGTPVTYAQPSAADLVDGAETVSCAPASGRTFPLGTTTVTCQASDSHSNTATA